MQIHHFLMYCNEWSCNNEIKSGGSVERRASTVIERLRNLGSTPDAVARRCVLGKDT